MVIISQVYLAVFCFSHALDPLAVRLHSSLKLSVTAKQPDQGIRADIKSALVVQAHAAHIRIVLILLHDVRDILCHQFRTGCIVLVQYRRLLCISVITFCGIPLKFRSINITFCICLHGIDSTAVRINGDRQVLPGTVCQRISSNHDLALTGSFIPLVICIIQLISLYCHVTVAGIRIIIQLQVFGNIYIFLLFCLSHLIRSILPAAGCKRHCHNGCQCDRGCFSAP